jgi:hypothetical protein
VNGASEWLGVSATISSWRREATTSGSGRPRGPRPGAAPGRRRGRRTGLGQGRWGRPPRDPAGARTPRRTPPGGGGSSGAFGDGQAGGELKAQHSSAAVAGEVGGVVDGVAAEQAKDQDLALRVGEPGERGHGVAGGAGIPTRPRALGNGVAGHRQPSAAEQELQRGRQHDDDEQGSHDDGGPGSHAAADSTRFACWRGRGPGRRPWPGGRGRWRGSRGGPRAGRGGRRPRCARPARG